MNITPLQSFEVVPDRWRTKNRIKYEGKWNNHNATDNCCLAARWLRNMRCAIQWYYCFTINHKVSLSTIKELRVFITGHNLDASNTNAANLWMKPNEAPVFASVLNSQLKRIVRYISKRTAKGQHLPVILRGHGQKIKRRQNVQCGTFLAHISLPLTAPFH